jgi:membrane-associated phospholipid phosphatase
VRNYSFVDYATQAYLALVAVLILFFHGSTVPRWQLLFLCHLIALALVHWLITSQARQPCPAAQHNPGFVEPYRKTISFLRHFYPVLLYTGLFAETGWLNQMFIHGFLDPVVIAWDQALFGCQPSLLLMEKFPFLPLSELLYVAYFSYYIMIGGVGLALYFKNGRQFFHYVSVVSFVFYVCYTIFIFLPVIGPPVFFREVLGYSLPENLQRLAPPEGYPAAVKAGVFYQIMKWIYRVFEAPGAAIPSSHVAIAICTLSFSFRYLRSIRWLHLVFVVLLCLATIYCRYHYVCDVLAGLATAAIFIPLGDWLFNRLDPAARLDLAASRALPALSTAQNQSPKQSHPSQS